MKDRVVTIQVIGAIGTGKSTITYLIKEYLKSRDLEVVLKESIDFDSEEMFDEVISKNIEAKTEAVKNRTKILIEEKQSNRRAENIEKDLAKNKN